MSIILAKCKNCNFDIIQVDGSRWWHSGISSEAVSALSKKDKLAKVLFSFIKMNSSNSKSMDMIGIISQLYGSMKEAGEKHGDTIKKYTNPDFSRVRTSYGNVSCHAALFENDRSAWNEKKLDKNLEATPKNGTSRSIY